MKRNDNFILKQYNDVFYLLPFGQAAADLCHTLELNEVGAFLWEILKKETSMEHLIRLAMEKYASCTEDIAQLTEDIYSFTDMLRSKHLLIDDETSIPHSSCTDFTIKIAGIKMNFTMDCALLSDCFKPFLVETSSSCDCHVVVKYGYPAGVVNGSVLIRNRELLIMDTDREYIMVYSALKKVKEIRLSKDLKEVVIFVLPPEDKDMKEEIYLALRTPFLLNALNRGMVMLHSASLLYKGRLYCFTGPSGTGKSTHTNLWKQLFDVTLINGDLNLLAPAEDCTYVYGTPWCGTSGIFEKNEYILGGIIFLSQSPTDSVKLLDKKEAYPKLVSRITSPSFVKEMGETIFSLCEKIANTTPCLHLACRPEPSAVYTVKQQIDLL